MIKIATRVPKKVVKAKKDGTTMILLSKIRKVK